MVTLAAESRGVDWELEFGDYFAARVVPLRRLAYALCGDWHLAEDLVQITFVKLYRHWRRIRAETVDAYARRTLVNTFLSDRRGRRMERVLNDLPDRSGYEPTDLAQGIDLRRCLARLSPQQRAMVVLRYLEDLSVADVAAVLGVAEGTVKSQTARGIQSLRRALGALTESEE
jgi:RNA polymerase sigma-70 factor (sigma-E family)